MDTKQKKMLLIFSMVIAIFVIGIVYKTFQNDTFFNISIGKHILENGIDMKEHFCWSDDDLYYSHSHWLFDIVIYLIYHSFGFVGIYYSTVVFSIFIAITLFVLLSKRSKSPIVAFFVTMISMYIIKDAFTPRSQIISFLCFIIEIYCIEQFIETNKKRYSILLIIQSIIIANFHAATWPLVLILFLPYFAAEALNKFSSKNIYKICIKRLENKIQKLPTNSPKISDYEKDIEDYKKIMNEPKSELANYKIIRKESYNAKNLIILFIIISLTGLITPIHGTPYTYIFKSMFGTSNFEEGMSIQYINEMKPIIPINNTAFIIFSSLIIVFLAFLPTKLKTEHGFLLLGLIFMTLISRRYIYILVLLGSYVLTDLISQTLNISIKDDITTILELIFSSIPGACVLIILVSIFSTNKALNRINEEYVDSKTYPIAVVDYIKNYLDYRNIKIYNSYNNGSYLMLHDIPVFIDSRLDVYCSEFNDTDIFYDYIQVSLGLTSYYEIFDKYGFTHILLEKDDIPQQYICNDPNYNLIFEDNNFVLYEKVDI